MKLTVNETIDVVGGVQLIQFGSQLTNMMKIKSILCWLFLATFFYIRCCRILCTYGVEMKKTFHDTMDEF